MSSSPPPLTVGAHTTLLHTKQLSHELASVEHTALYLPASSQQKRSLCLRDANCRQQVGHFNLIKDPYQVWLSQKESELIPCVH